MKRFALIFVSLAIGCAQPETPASREAPPPVTLELAWRAQGLANPESVALSDGGDFLYVSNVNGDAAARDGNGFISRVSTDGRMLEREWATGLNAPKGVALLGDSLFVADIDRVVEIDAVSGDIRASVDVPGARFLNDLAIANDDAVLVADSAIGRISVVRGRAVETWLEDPMLDSINGLLPELTRLVATTMAGRLLAVDYRTRTVTVLAEGLGDADGVAAIGEGRYLVSEWPGLMHVVAADGTHTTILDSRAEERYLNDFLLVGDRLYQPHWEPGELSAYTVSGVR